MADHVAGSNTPASSPTPVTELLALCAADYKAAEPRRTARRDDAYHVPYVPAPVTAASTGGLDLTGKRFGRLVAVNRAGKRHGKITWRCVCDCGNEKTVIGSQLKSGRTKSCGCGAPQVRNLVGQQFGRLTVIKFSGRSDGKKPVRLWLCLCSCGTETTVRGRALVTGNTRSCGCLHAQTVRTSSLVHGQTGTPLHSRWKGMRTRCENPNQKGYANYGGRGIKVCDRWLEPNGQGFLNFAADMGPSFSPELELDRIDVNGDYTPQNCRWITRAENQQNKRNNRSLDAEPLTEEEAVRRSVDRAFPVVAAFLAEERGEDQ